jgi:hypothetical protein
MLSMRLLRAVQRWRTTSRMASRDGLIGVLHVRARSTRQRLRMCGLEVAIHVSHRRAVLVLLLLLLGLDVAHHMLEVGSVHLLHLSTLALLCHQVSVHLLSVLLQIGVGLRRRDALGLGLCLQGLELVLMLSTKLVRWGAQAK